MLEKNRMTLIWLAGVAVTASLSARVDPLAYTGGRARDEEQRLRRNSSALAAMLGEFRTSMSDIMFIKTERYLHAGIGYLPHHDETVLSVAELADAVEDPQRELGMRDTEKEHAGHPALIPAREHDFRGFVGILHRQVKPWRDPSKPHIHTDGRELLPWFRVMTMSDPHYVRGYLAGGFWLQIEDPDAALAFINEGLRHNPGAFQLYVSRGFLRLRQARRFGDPVTGDPGLEMREILEPAREDFRRGADLMLQTRPVDVNADGDRGWSPYQENDALAAVNMTVVLTRTLDGAVPARTLAQRYVKLFPDSEPLIRIAHDE